MLFFFLLRALPPRHLLYMSNDAELSRLVVYCNCTLMFHMSIIFTESSVFKGSWKRRICVRGAEQAECKFAILLVVIVTL